MSASASPSGGASGFTEEEVRAVFDKYDVDGNGTIDRTELRLLAFDLGRLMDDEELEAAFTALDADGSGSVDFDELFQWLNSSEAGSHTGATQAALRASLTRRMAMHRAKALKNRLVGLHKSAGQAVQGTIDLDLGWSFGKRALAEAASSDAISAKITVDGSGKAAQVQDTSAQEGERTVVQLFMKLHAGVTDEDVAALVGPLNAFLEQTVQGMDGKTGDLAVTRATIAGPLPLPPSMDDQGGAAAATDRCLVVEVFVAQDPLKPILKALEELTDAAGMEDTTQLVQHLVEQFQVSLTSSQTLQELLGLAPASGSSSSSLITIKGKLAKSVLSVFQELAQGMLQEATASGFDAKGGIPMTLIQHAMAVDNLSLKAQMKDEERLAAAAAAGLQTPSDSKNFEAKQTMLLLAASDPLTPLRAMMAKGVASAFLSVCKFVSSCSFMPEEALDELVQGVMYLLTGQPADLFPPVDAQGGDGDEEAGDSPFPKGMRELRWIVENASEVHSVRLAGRGLGVVLDFTGVSLTPLAQLAQNLMNGALHNAKTPEDEDGMSDEYVKGRVPVLLLAGADPALMDATMAWCSASGTKDNEKTYFLYKYFGHRVVVLPSGNAAIVEVPDDGEHRWRTALLEGKTAVLPKAIKEDSELMKQWVNTDRRLRHKARCICLGVLRASDVPELTAAGGGDGMPSKAAQTTGRVMSSLLQDWQEHMEVTAVVDSDAKKQRLQPWAAVLVHEDVPVAAAAKEGAAAALKAALDLPQDAEELRVIFANLGSGSGVLHGMAQLVDAAVAEHNATMEVFGPDAKRGD